MVTRQLGEALVASCSTTAGAWRVIRDAGISSPRGRDAVNIAQLQQREKDSQSEPSELELDDVVITNPHIEAILENEDWIEDASGLVSHCIAILKICHTLTEKLVAMTMGSGARMKSPTSLSDIIVVAKRISPRVDDVVRSMYPPLDPKLLDARTTALLLSVSHLVLVTRNTCHLSGGMDWIDQSLSAAEEHMTVLREAALATEPERSIAGGAESFLQEQSAI
ncbi:transmembrane protein 98-like [Mauremys reevesii]|uniref:transmembrane protein 98-like n=1 Tax=Mauremys reevesii TaxID=260615 RepID=UPI00193F3066|nr:transmembrane protein 98-like [Mauremys reevesii]